jgi:hypothetical protein
MNDPLPIPPELSHLIEKRDDAQRRDEEDRRETQTDGEEVLKPDVEQRRGSDRRALPDRRE